MAKYRQIHIEFWQDGFVLDLTPEEKYFYIYLMTNSKTSQCGIYELPKRIVETETGYNRETVEKLLKRFVDYGKIEYEESTKEIFIVNWLKYNSVKSPKVFECVRKELTGVKTKRFIESFYKTCLQYGYNTDAVPAEYQNAIDTISEDYSDRTNTLSIDYPDGIDTLSIDLGEEEKKKNNNNNKNKKNTGESRKQVYDDDSLYLQISKKLFERILENNPDHKEPNLQKWADDARLMMERDGRTEEQVVFLIDWSQKHHFWASNILSIGKLREKFDQLVMQFKKERDAAKNPGGRGKLREEKKPAWFGQPEPSQGDAADEDAEFLAQRAAMEAELAAREAGKSQNMKVTG